MTEPNPKTETNQGESNRIKRDNLVQAKEPAC